MPARAATRCRPTAPITYRDLLTHTSGLTYGFMNATPVDAMYRDQGVDFQTSDASLGEVVEKAAGLPLLAQPGAAWNYSIATDVVGHLVAELSGKPFATFLQERVLDPLGMDGHRLQRGRGQARRFAANYMKGEDGRAKLLDDPATSIFIQPRKIASGGGGLTGTARDYMRFCHMMLNKGTLDGERLLGRKTVELMTMNHLGGDMAAMGTARFSESNYNGIGFGLGFSVMLDPAARPDRRHARRIRLGRRREHRVLDRSGGRTGGRVPDPAHPLQHLSDPPRIARADLCGHH